LAGKLSNSSATSVEYMNRLAEARRSDQTQHRSGGRFLNQIEPQEGKFDFSVLDGLIQGARSHNMRLVLLWFATWKNGLSSYPPDW